MNHRLLTALFGAALLASTAAPAISFAAPKPAVWHPPGATAEPRADWTYSGCWSRSGSGGCVDIYRDATGQAWQCKACGTTKSPGPGKCTKVSQPVLDLGRWCS